MSTTVYVLPRQSNSVIGDILVAQVKHAKMTLDNIWRASRGFVKTLALFLALGGGIVIDVQLEVRILILSGIFWVTVTIDLFFFSIFRLGLEKGIDWLLLNHYRPSS